MASVSIYLNFAGNAEAAFNHYKKVFNTEFSSPLMRMGDMPPLKELSNGEKDAVAPHQEFWGYWGTCKDRFGVRWMFNVMNPQQQ